MRNLRVVDSELVAHLPEPEALGREENGISTVEVLDFEHDPAVLLRTCHVLMRETASRVWVGRGSMDRFCKVWTKVEASDEPLRTTRGYG